MPLIVPIRTPDSEQMLSEYLLCVIKNEWVSWVTFQSEQNSWSGVEWMVWMTVLFLQYAFIWRIFFLNRKVWRIKNTHYSNESLVTFFHICFRFLLKETKHSRLIWPFVLYPTPILLYLSSEVRTIVTLLWMHFVSSYTFTYKYMHQLIHSRS